MYWKNKSFILTVFCIYLTSYLGCVSRKIVTAYPTTLVSEDGFEIELGLKDKKRIAVDSLILGEFESQYWIKRIDEAHKVPNTNIVSLRTIERQKGQTIGFVIVSVLGGVWGYRSAYQLSVEMEGGDSARHKKAGRTIGATSALLSGFLIGAPIGKSIGWKTVYMLNDTTSTQ